LLTSGAIAVGDPSESRFRASILLVDDHPANLLALEVVLEPLGQRTVRASSGEEALARLREEEFAVVLLDIMMPGVSGLTTAEQLRSEARGRQLPIIFMTAGDTSALEGYTRGGVDVLRKPLDPDAVRAKVAVFVELFRAREQLREQAARLATQERAAQARTAALLNASLDGVIGMDQSGHISEFNAAAEAMFGLRRADVLGRALADVLIPPRLRDAHRNGLAHYLTTGERRILDTRVEVTALHADGTEFPIELAIRRVASDGLPTFLGYARDLTARRAAERGLEVAEAKFRRIFDANMIGFVFSSASGRVFEANDYVLKMLGLTVAEVKDGRVHLRDLTPPEYQTAHAEALQRLRKADVTAPFEMEYIARDGRRIPVVLGSARMPGSAGEAELVTFILDVSDRKAMEVERQRTEIVRAFLARASDAFASSLDYEATLQTVVRMAVPHVADWCAVDMVRNDSRESVQLAVSHVDPAKVRLAEELRRRYPADPKAPRGVPRVLQTGRSELYEDIPHAMLEQSARDAEHLHLLQELGLRSAIIVPITTHGRTLGAITFVAAESGRRYGPADLATAEDLARRAAIAIENARLYRATQLGEARNRFLAEATEALSSSLDYTATLQQVARLAVPTIAESAAVYRLEEDGALRLITLAAVDPKWEALARELDALLPLHVDHQDRTLPRVVRTGRSEVLSELPDAVRATWSPTSRAEEIMRELSVHSYMVVPLVVRGHVFGALALTTSAAGRRLEPDDLALAEELARRAGLAIDNARLYREVNDASRLKDEFLATVSHELRTPLTAMLGWIHLLRKGQPAQVTRAVDTIERNAHAQARIIDDILDVSRIITGKLGLELGRVNLADILRAAVETVRPAAEAKAIDVNLELDPCAGETTGDAARLQQVAWNLLSNAIKFTPKGGRIDVQLARHGSDARLRVSDNGHGIRPDFLPHVFERFRQGDSTSTRAVGGLGLGLSIVRHLVELHGGHVTAESEGEERGARFTVTLPMIEPSAGSTPPAATRQPSAGAVTPATLSLQGVRVLVVDDELDTRDFLAALLEEHGASVTTAASAHAATRILANETPDVLVSDIGMPDQDGYVFLREARAVGVEGGYWFPAIALTAYTRAQDRNEALLAGYQVHLSKPIDPATLVAAVLDLAKPPT
jgi:PAS domain S-box-containing protein